jgi:hypothetical protein
MQALRHGGVPSSEETHTMKKTQAIGISLCLALAALSTGANAKGCLKGAAVGGVAGHFAHRHGLLGAAAGCAVGHHQAKKKELAQQEQQRQAQVAHR